MRIEKLTTHIGAELSGVDLAEAARDDDLFAAIEAALLEHKVLFLRDQAIGRADHVAFAERFGALEDHPVIGSDPDYPSLVRIYKDESSPLEYFENAWHCDATWRDAPPMGCVLRCVACPPVGGDTMWANVAAAYDALSSRTQRLLDGMEALHSTAAVARHFPSDLAQQYFGDGESAVHPVVPTDPDTGRKFLYVNSNYTERLLGMSEWESTRLLQMLFDHVNTPEFHVRLRWRIGTVAIWHERLTQHRGVADYRERRVLRRMTVVGEAPTP
jgi:taurine dioxygenase